MPTRKFVASCSILGDPNRPMLKAAATLKPEPTQHNSLDRLQIRKYKSKTLMSMSAATLKRQTVWGVNIPVVPVSV